MRLPIVIHKDSDSEYGVTVPDLPGCFSAGETLDEAFGAAKEAIECHLEGLLLDGDPIPQPLGIEAHQSHLDYAGGTWGIVEVDLAELADKARRINISIPVRVLTLVDRAAKRAGETRSGFITRAAMEQVRRETSR